jgi:hypothetical protein
MIEKLSALTLVPDFLQRFDFNVQVGLLVDLGHCSVQSPLPEVGPDGQGCFPDDIAHRPEISAPSPPKKIIVHAPPKRGHQGLRASRRSGNQS